MEALTAIKSLAPIREIQFKDSQGNVIREPDASNPSRPKFERPLDTIRGFEERIRRAEREERVAYMRAGKSIIHQYSLRCDNSTTLQNAYTGYFGT